jgi:hypothetical protein
MWAIDSRTARSWTRFAAAMGDVGRRGESGSRVLGDPQALNSHGTGPSIAHGAARSSATPAAAMEHRKSQRERYSCRLHRDQNTRSRARASRVAALPALTPSLTLIALPGHFARCNTVEHMSLSTYYITAARAHVVLLSLVGPDLPVRPWALPTSTAHFGRASTISRAMPLHTTRDHLPRPVHD